MFLRIARSDSGENGGISVNLLMYDRMGGVSSPEDGNAQGVRVQGLDSL